MLNLVLCNLQPGIFQRLPLFEIALVLVRLRLLRRRLTPV